MGDSMPRGAPQEEDAGDAIGRAPELAAGGTSGTRWRRVMLSDRDWEILTWAHEQKFLMPHQIAWFFPEGAPNPKVKPKENPTPGTLRRRARSGSWYGRERQRKLSRFGVIRRVPVFTEPAAALLPGRVGFDLLEGTGRSHGLARLDGIDWKNYAHDRAVTDVRWRLACPASAAARANAAPNGAGWKSERVLRRELPAGHVPDALVTLGSRTVALEVELTRKSTRRYMAILQRYLAWRGPRLDAVLYVVPESTDLRHLFAVVLPAALKAPGLWGARQPDLRLFQFTTVRALELGKVWSTTSTPAMPMEGSLWPK